MSIETINELISEHTHESATDVSDGNDLASEVGELCGVIRTKRLYENNPELRRKIDLEVEATKSIKDQLTEEAGDILFYLLRILQRNDITLQEAIEDQQHKLRGKSISLERTYKK